MEMQTLAHQNGSPCLQDADADSSQAAVPYLPEDIWSYIHSLMPMPDAARAACLSRAFLHSWRCRPNLTLDRNTLYPGKFEGNLNTAIDSILINYSGIGLKILSLHLSNVYIVFPCIDSWLQAAVIPGIEELSLGLHANYNFPCSLLSDGVRNSIRCLQLFSCTFRPTVELGPLRCLTKLGLWFVCITGDELECLLSNSLALEKLDLYNCKEIHFLKIPCVLQQFRRLSVSCSNLLVIENKAPNLSSIHFGGKVVGETLQMKNLSMGRSERSVHYARAKLPSIMPNLETLEMRSDYEVVNTPMLPTKFLYLKHLNIQISGLNNSRSYDCFSLVSFLDASPSLQTLFLEISLKGMKQESIFGCSSHMRQLPKHCHCEKLKSVEIIGFSHAKSLVELTCCIVKSAVSLDLLTLDTLPVNYTCPEKSCIDASGRFCLPITKAVLDEASRAQSAIRMYIEGIVPATAKLTVRGPCTRCISIATDADGLHKVLQILRECELCQNLA